MVCMAPVIHNSVPLDSIMAPAGEVTTTHVLLLDLQPALLCPELRMRQLSARVDFTNLAVS